LIVHVFDPRYNDMRLGIFLTIVHRVSVPVALDALRGRIEQYGPNAHLVTVSSEGHPHVVSVVVEMDGGQLTSGAGRTTTANVAANPAVTFLWAAPKGDDYSLLVDATATATDGVLTASPTRAVLHRVAGAPGEGPSCIEVG